MANVTREDFPMPWQSGHPGSHWGSGTTASLDLEDLLRQGQNRLKQIMPAGRPRGIIVLAVLALVGWGAWTSYYTVSSDSVAVVQRFGKYLKDVSRDCISSCRWALTWRRSFPSSGS